MAFYCAEKFERAGSFQELSVCWRQDRHVHDARLITTIERKLGDNRGGTWCVRANSYRSHLSSPPLNAVMYDDI